MHLYDGDGYVAFVDTGGAWVAAGAPIGPSAEAPQRAQRFVQRARQEGRRACFFGVDESLADRAQLRSLALGAEPRWDPRAWTDVLSSSRSLREQLRRARAKRVTVRQLESAELAPGQDTRRQLTDLASTWLSSRSMAPMGFLVRLDLFGHADERLYLAAERGEELVGLLVAVPIYQESGWLVEDLLRAPHSPNGTMELLIDAAMQRFVELDSPVVSMGMAPLAGEVAPPLRALRRLTGWLYDFEGVRAFKEKLGPGHWQPLVVAFPHTTSRVRVVLDTLTAFSDGGLLSFALSTLRRQRRGAVAVVGAIWIGLAALVPFVQAHWFPSPAWRSSWLVLLAVTAVLALSLAGRWRAGLAWALAATLVAHGLLATVQLSLVAEAAVDGVLAVGLATGATLGPVLAALLVAHAALVGDGPRADSIKPEP